MMWIYFIQVVKLPKTTIKVNILKNYENKKAWSMRWGHGRPKEHLKNKKTVETPLLGNYYTCIFPLSNNGMNQQIIWTF